MGNPPPRYRWFIAGLFLILANSASLALFLDPGPFLASLVFAHLVIGIGLALLTLLLGVWLLRNRSVFAEPRAISVGLLSLLLSCVLGLVLIPAGAFGAGRILLGAHVGLGGLGVFFLLAVTLRRWRTIGVGRLISGATIRRALKWAVLAVGIAGLALAVVPAVWKKDDRLAREEKVPQFFPSRATTANGKPILAQEVASSRYCGECHKDIYSQWLSSQHHFGSFGNIFYRKAAQYTMQRKGAIAFRFCAGCHDPALLLSGLVDEQKENINLDSPAAVEGISCVGCHAIKTISVSGTGSYEIDRLGQFPFASHPYGRLRTLNKLLIRLKPDAHRRAFLKPPHNQAEFCAPCHKVTIEAAVNEFRWLRGFSEYDEWQRSAWSGQAVTTFYTAPEAKRCQDCHMPAIASSDPPEAGRGFVHDHRFIGSNTVVPLIQGDWNQFLKVREFLTSAKLSVDIFAVWRGQRFGQAGMWAPGDVWMPLDRTQAEVEPGEWIQVDVVVRNQGVGHKFPAATLDLWDAWLEFLVTDATGKIVFSSGHLADLGEVDPGAHFFRNRPLDRRGQWTDKSNRFDTVTILYDSAIPAGAADVVHYQFRVPGEARGPLALRARLNHRKYTPYFTRWVFGGRPAPGQQDRVSSKVDARNWILDEVPLPRLPILTLAGDVQMLGVAGSGTRLLSPGHPGEGDALRFNDYGIGLFRQGDYRGAEEAFRKVMELQPDYADGLLNLARVFLATSPLEAAQEKIAQALRQRPDYLKAIFFRGEVALILGHYEQALADFKTVLEHYPRDRAVHARAGRAYYLSGKFSEATGHFQKILDIDPEERQAYYNLMLCYQALGDVSRAEAARDRYEGYRPDFSIKQVQADYRTRYKMDSIEAEPVHVHGPSSKEP